MIIINNDFNVEKQTFYHYFSIIRTTSISSGEGGNPPLLKMKNRLLGVTGW